MAMNGTTDMVLKKLNATAWKPIFSLEKVFIVIIITFMYLMKRAFALDRSSMSRVQMSSLKNRFRRYVLLTILFIIRVSP